MKAFLILAVAFATWAVLKGIVTTRTTRTRHVIVQQLPVATAVESSPDTRSVPRPQTAPVARALRPPPPVPSHPPVAPPQVFEKVLPTPSTGPAINERAEAPSPPDPVDFHHSNEEPMDEPAFHEEGE